MADTRLEAAVNAVVNKIITDTGINIHPPPLRDSGDCAVRVSGDRTKFVTLNTMHGEKEVDIVVYCKADSSKKGADTITAIQDHLDTAAKPEPDIVQITRISTSNVHEDNSGGEWIYEMNVTITYCY